MSLSSGMFLARKNMQKLRCIFVRFFFGHPLNQVGLVREGFKKKKKLVENSTKQGGGGSAPDFPLRKKTKKTLDFA